MSLETIKWQEVSWTGPSTRYAPFQLPPPQPFPSILLTRRSRSRRATMTPLSPMSTIPEYTAPRKKNHCPTKIPTLFRSAEKASSKRDSMEPLRAPESANDVSQSKAKSRILTFQRASGEWLSIVSFLGSHCDAPTRHSGVIGRAL